MIRGQIFYTLFYSKSSFFYPKNLITINNVLEYCQGDKEAYTKAIAIAQPCYYLEFKIVPNCNIHGNYKDENEAYNNPFIEFVDNNIKEYN